MNSDFAFSCLSEAITNLKENQKENLVDHNYASGPYSRIEDIDENEQIEKDIEVNVPTLRFEKDDEDENIVVLQEDIPLSIQNASDLLNSNEKTTSSEEIIKKPKKKINTFDFNLNYFKDLVFNKEDEENFVIEKIGNRFLKLMKENNISNLCSHRGQLPIVCGYMAGKLESIDINLIKPDHEDPTGINYMVGRILDGKDNLKSYNKRKEDKEDKTQKKRKQLNDRDKVVDGHDLGV